MPTLDQQRLQIAHRVTIIGMILDIVLGVLKLIVGKMANSHALIADGVHSLSDAVTDIFVLIVTRISNHGPDSKHPYGHARFETIGTTLLGSSLVAIAVILAYNYLNLLNTQRDATLPTWPALIVAALSIVGKEWIYQLTRKTGEKINSSLLIANAWHSRSDAFSSIVVLIGVAASMLGYAWVDVIAAILVALIIGKIGISLVWENLKELVDTGLDEPELHRIRETLLQIDGIINVHDLRTRRMANSVLLDMHLQVAPDISVSEGHNIGEWAARELLGQFESINDVIYHIDVEDDQDTRLSANNNLLPLRHQVLEALSHCWESDREVKSITLHYLENRVDIELFLNRQPSEAAAGQIESRLIAQKSKYPWLGDISVWTEH